MWIYLPRFTSFQSVQDQEPEILPSDSRFQTLEQFVLWRSKRMPSRLWYARWKKVPWLQRLFGQMPEPSRAEIGVLMFMASLPLTPASRFHAPANGKAKQIPATSGPISPALSESASLPWCSSKMYADICASDLKASAEIFKRWATRLGRDYSALKRWVRRTEGLGCSPWPTAASSWFDRGQTSSEVWAKRQADRIARGEGVFADPLHVAATAAKHNGSRPLNEEVLKWGSPTGGDSKGRAYQYDQMDHSKPRDTLTGEAQNWGTPRVTTNQGQHGNPARMDDGKARLEDQVTGFAVPTNSLPTVPETSSDGLSRWKRHFGSDLHWADSISSFIPLDALVYSMWASRPIPKLHRDGKKKKPTWIRLDAPYVRPSLRRKLNVYFDEWLQGWPPNWSSAEKESIGFDQWERESRRLLWHLHSLYSQRPTGSDSTDQPSLF